MRHNSGFYLICIFVVASLKDVSDHGQSQRKMFLLLQVFESLGSFLNKSL